MDTEHTAVKTGGKELGRQFVLRMAFQSGICDEIDFRTGLEPFRQRHGVLALTLDTERERSDTAEREP